MKRFDGTIAGCSRGRGLVLLLGASALMLTGCGLSGGNNTPASVSLSGMHGDVHGGQQPVQNANIYLYAAGTSGYNSTNTNILTTGVQTNANGGFSVTGDYSCTAGQQIYIVAVGGNPGGGTNANLVLAAALGDCATLGPSTHIAMNEVTTVAAAYALAPFANGYAAIGTDSGNLNGIVRAFVNAGKLANVAAGSAGGALPAGATVSTDEIYAIADILSSCVNSQGGTAGDTTNCGYLFHYTTPPGGSAPTDVFGAAINMAKYPTNQVGPLFGRLPTQPPFATAMTAPPNDWTVAIVYGGASFNAPVSTTVDGSGQVWVANSGNNTLSVLAQTGTPITGSPFSGNGLNDPVAVAASTGGSVSVANKGATTVSVFTASGAAANGSPWTAGSGPDALAYDAAGNLWVANFTGNSLMELSASGSLLQTITGGVSAPSSVVLNPK